MGNTHSEDIKPIRNHLEQLCQFLYALQGDPSNVGVIKNLSDLCQNILDDISIIARKQDNHSDKLQNLFEHVTKCDHYLNTLSNRDNEEIITFANNVAMEIKEHIHLLNGEIQSIWSCFDLKSRLVQDKCETGDPESRRRSIDGHEHAHIDEISNGSGYSIGEHHTDDSAIADGVEILTKPTKKFIFNLPIIQEHKAFLRIQNNGTIPLNWFARTNCLGRVNVAPSSGTLRSYEEYILFVTCSQFDYQSTECSEDRVILEWHVFEEDQDVTRKVQPKYEKRMPIEYNH